MFVLFFAALSLSITIVAASDAYPYWIDHYLVDGVRWKYELCPLSAPTPAPTPTPNPFTLQHQYTCVAARQTYLATNPDVDGVYIDPVYHYQVCNFIFLIQFFLGDTYNRIAEGLKGVLGILHNVTRIQFTLIQTRSLLVMLQLQSS